MPTETTGGLRDQTEREEALAVAARDGARRAGTYAVKLVRGPFVRLEPHPGSCATVTELAALVARLRKEIPQRMLVADLFSGAGGLSLGLEQAGLRVVVGVDHDPESVETHRHHFGGLTLDRDLSDPEQVQQVAELVRSLRLDVVVGGPPCQPFSRAGRSKIRHAVRLGLAPAHDPRRDLWASFLSVISAARPRCVLMENVPDMALDREMFILRAVIHALENIGYSVEVRLVDTSHHGVPQVRQRLIIVGILDGVRFRWPADASERISVWNAIGDLPEVEGGWRPPGGAEGWSDYDRPLTEFQRSMRAGVPSGYADRVYDQVTRPVRPDDLQAFELMDPTTLYSDLPPEVKRYRDDIFDDKYKRLDENRPSRTITAHIAKDGYWYIHPRQNRTLTVREAARLQTFPDHVRFAGPPSAAFRQIGNAVPPRLGKRLGLSLAGSLKGGERAGPSTTDVARRLGDWFAAQAVPVLPWLREATRWQVVLGEVLLDRATPEQIRVLWPLLARWRDPAATIAAEPDLLRMAGWIRRETRARRMLETAAWLVANPDALDEPDPDRRIPNVAPSIVDLAVLVEPGANVDAGPEPVLISRGALRVANRYAGGDAERRNRMSAGRIAVARLIGGPGAGRAAHLGLILLATTVCRPRRPRCSDCPLSGSCSDLHTRVGHR